MPAEPLVALARRAEALLSQIASSASFLPAKDANAGALRLLLLLELVSLANGEVTITDSGRAHLAKARDPREYAQIVRAMIDDLNGAVPRAAQALRQALTELVNGR